MFIHKIYVRLPYINIEIIIHETITYHEQDMSFLLITSNRYRKGKTLSKPNHRIIARRGYKYDEHICKENKGFHREWECRRRGKIKLDLGEKWV